MGAAADRQQRFVDFLLQPGNWPEAEVAPDHVQTHISHLFLGQQLALKMKKAVKLPYLDFSTLERRERFCRREVEVNARFSRKLYLGIGCIIEEKGGLKLVQGEPPPGARVVEWLVRMRRFDGRMLLEQVVARGAFDDELQRQLAESVCAAHRKAEVVAGVDMHARLMAVLEQVKGALLAAGSGRKRRQLQNLLAQLAARFDAARKLLAQRSAAGFVRRCHGDMHLGNIVVWQGRPLLFDAIEFDEELASIDILYDLAFLLMDLVHRGHKPAANVLMNRWLALCDDARHHRAVALLAPMMALRALIRAMVALDLAAQEATMAAAKRREAAAYVQRAEQMLQPVRAQLIVVAGLSGSGKTTLARALAARLAPAAGMVHLRSDVERKVMAKVAETERLPPEAYTPEMAARVYERLLTRAEAALQGGWPVIIDAVFGKAEERQAVEALARRLQVPLRPLWLTAPEEVLIERVRQRRGDASDAREEVVRLQAQFVAQEAIDWPKVEAHGSADEVLRRALALLGDAGA